MDDGGGEGAGHAKRVHVGHHVVPGTNAADKSTSREKKIQTKNP